MCASIALVLLLSGPVGAGVEDDTQPPPTSRGGAGYVGVPEGPGVWAGVEVAPTLVAAVNRNSPAVATIWCGIWNIGTDLGQIELTDRVTNFIDGQYYALLCFRIADGENTYGSIILWPPRRDQFPAATVPGLSELAIKALPLTPPQLSSQPPLTKQVIGFETWYSAPTATTLERSAQAGGFWATAQARPIGLKLNFGDTTAPLTCPLPLQIDATGRPTCARHTYLDHRNSPTGNGAYTLTATITYQIWLATNENPTFALVDTLDSPPLTTPAAARQIQAILN